MPGHVWKHVLDVEPNRHLQQLGEISESDAVLTRTYFSDAHMKAAHKILRWMEQAGMTAYIDAIGNVHGVVEGSNPELGELLVGSHYDTVVDGGKFDGAMGLLLAISAVKAVHLEALKRANKLSMLQWAIDNVSPDEDIDLPIRAVKGLLSGSIRVVGFCDEEGIRFKSTFLGSRAIAGTLLKHNQLAARGADGRTLEEVLATSGGLTGVVVPNPTEAVQALALKPGSVRHYVEFHIEQGPQLEAAGLALGVVSGIAGQTWLAVSVEGVQNHGGTVPMPLRKDPMAAAAEAITAVEGTCLGSSDALGELSVEGEALVCTVGSIKVHPNQVRHENRLTVTDIRSNTSQTWSNLVKAGIMCLGEMAVAGEALVCTVGSIKVHPNQVNIIPKWVNFTVDVRCRREEFRQEVIALAEARIQAVCARRGVNCSVTRTHNAPPVHSDGRLVSKLQEAVRNAQPMIQQLAAAAEDSSSSSSSSSNACSASGGSDSSSCTAGNAGSISSFRSTQSEVPVLLSGAGHDAMAIADITKIGMVFVRCAGGVSHNPAEYVDPRDVAAATAAFATFMEMDVLDWEQHSDDSYKPVS
uniref:Peptidase M20 dimerisation domain-containing protein n=1 Tax=Tetradesmus obliquus TaxID=3088 RepID=A0A383W484_TETOB